MRIFAKIGIAKIEVDISSCQARIENINLKISNIFYEKINLLFWHWV